MADWHEPARKKPKTFDLETVGGYREYQDWRLAEETFQARLIALAKTLGWDKQLIYHTRWSVGSTGGFPDLVLADPSSSRLVFIELKRMGVNPTPAQMLWLDALRDAGQEVYLFRPDDQPEIERVLQRSPRSA